MNFLANERLEQMNWFSLSSNPNAIPLLEANLDKVCWVSLSENPKAFRYDYEEMKASRDALAEALMKERFHPKHITQFESWGFWWIKGSILFYVYNKNKAWVTFPQVINEYSD